MAQIVKLSTPWNHDFMKLTPQGSGIFGSYKFEIDNTCSECDYWVVWGNLREPAKVKCAPENIIYVTDETHAQRSFNAEFLNQFFSVIACRKDLHHSRIIPSHDLGIWHLDKSYDEVKALSSPVKSKQISVVSSDLTFLPGHKKRFTFTNQLMEHFKDRMSYFGRGINTITDKSIALDEYQYSVAIENSFIEGYFTEKIFECFLTNTLPLYYGCPDLENYFDERSFIRIDIDNFKGALDTIENVLLTDNYREHQGYLKEAAKLYLEKYFFFPAVINIIERDELLRGRKKRTSTVLYPEGHFKRNYVAKLYHKVKQYIR